MIRSEMRTEVFRKLEEESSGPDFWTAAQINTALDEAYEEISDASEWYERHVSLPLLSNRTYYDMRHIPDSTYIAPRRCFNPQTNRWLDPLHERELDERTFRQWERNTGEPQRMFHRGLWWVGVWPKKGSDTGFLKLYFTSIPPALEDHQAPGFPQEFHAALVEYALFDLLAQEVETKKALAHLSQYQQLESGLRAWVDGRVRTDRINALRG